jgi:hypothetical protein
MASSFPEMFVPKDVREEPKDSVRQEFLAVGVGQ